MSAVHGAPSAIRRVPSACSAAIIPVEAVVAGLPLAAVMRRISSWS